jgi:hypothetical protein
MEELNLTRLRQQYGGKYVALWKGRVVVSARTHTSFMKKILPIIRTRPVELMFVPPKGMFCVY